MSLRHSPLHEVHTAYGARMVDSDGWSMPLAFAGVYQEYQAHRRGSVVWDASDLGAVRVLGPGAYDIIQRTFTNDLGRIGPGRSQYTFLLDEVDGSIVDDLMIWWVHSDLFVLTPNRPAAVLSALRPAVPGQACAIEDVGGSRVLLALQGSGARTRMAQFAPDVAQLPPLRVREWMYDDGPGFVSTTRFGGEIGFEVHLPPGPARAFYTSLVTCGVVPAGLGMRETQRLEMGIPRHGFELGPAISPLEAGFPHAVAFDTEFVGRAALLERQRRGIGRVLRALVMAGRGIPQPGSPLVRDGVAVGHITSGNFSPRLHRGLGLAYVLPEVELGSTVSVRSHHGDTDAQVTGVPVDLEAAW